MTDKEKFAYIIKMKETSKDIFYPQKVLPQNFREKLEMVKRKKNSMIHYGIPIVASTSVLGGSYGVYRVLKNRNGKEKEKNASFAHKFRDKYMKQPIVDMQRGPNGSFVMKDVLDANLQDGLLRAGFDFRNFKRKLKKRALIAGASGLALGTAGLIAYDRHLGKKKQLQGGKKENE